MKSDAIAIANYFVDKSLSDNSESYPLTLRRIVGYVYIAHGFALAILDKNIIDDRFDKVEAWDYGPVIPSVYYSFHHNGNNVITNPSPIVESENRDGTLTFGESKVKDKKTKKILDFVWKRYSKMPTGNLIDNLRKDGTPWAFCYRAWKNREIPDKMTKVYYQAMIEELLKQKQK